MDNQKLIDLIKDALLEVEHNGSPFQDTYSAQQNWADVRAKYIAQLLQENLGKLLAEYEIFPF